MKKTITISLLLLLILIKDLHSQSDWFWLDPLPTGATLKAVDFADQNTGYTCGKTGVVTKTTNGGLNWILMNPVTVYELMSIECLDQNTCIVVGDRGSIYKTTNGAQSWVNIPSGTVNILNDVTFVNSNVGYICGFGGLVYKTINQGNNWTLIASGLSATLYSISFIDENNGVAGGFTSVRTTTNGGLNWTLHQLGSFPDTFYEVNYVAPNLIYTFEAYLNKVFKTTNAGETWSTYETEVFAPGDIGRSMVFTNSQTGFIATQFGNIGKTTNGGVNWFLDTSFTPAFRILDVFWKMTSIDTSILYAVGTGGHVVRTTNSGGVWEKQVGNLKTYSDVFFTDNNTGYIVGKAGIVRKTTNAGQNWSDINLNTTYSLNKVFFTNSNTGYICGDSGLVRKTTDAGSNWISQATPAVDSNFLSLHFVNENTGYIGVYPLSILKTTNAGVNWIRNYTNPITDIGVYYDIDFINIEDGIVAGDNGILKTTNSGMNWSKVLIPSSSLNSINYLDSSNIIAFGSGNEILKSTDAGQTWININFQFGGNIYSSQFFGNQFGIICGQQGRVARTTNGGINWIFQEFLESELLYSLNFTDPNTGYVVGQGGQIIKTTNGGLSVVNLSSEVIPQDYILHQNYPNPFNPNTIIDYELRKSGVIRINVYDISGKHIKTLVNKLHSSGNYSFEMEASDLSSGVYFYTMYSNNRFINTKKFLIIK